MVNSALYAYLIVFWVSFISNAIPFGGPPYTIVTATTIIELNYNYFWELILTASIGAVISKIIIYFFGSLFEKRLSRNKNIILISKISKKYLFYLVLFILAIIPVLPFDDYIYLAGGAAKAGVYRMIIVTLVAKLLKTTIEILIELKLISLASYIFALSKPDIAIILTIIFIAIGIIGFKIDWEKEYNNLKNRIVK